MTEYLTRVGLPCGVTTSAVGSESDARLDSKWTDAFYRSPDPPGQRPPAPDNISFYFRLPTSDDFRIQSSQEDHETPLRFASRSGLERALLQPRPDSRCGRDPPARVAHERRARACPLYDQPARAAR